ncbi:iron ABC transporter permease [Arthrobacter zhangbolii]|uniref:Iron ABC transporter permease n=1 Tax=Arthrobacter zhangbolii TaxID=2886936 RepID=A0A9X1M6W5_9MICC|nr:iron ABC transporter permease [Arthrobacter zhangbolii]MCC3271875.1 iron ABC transporter permease [Arthrobacter zhangbolii]MCC3293781.1 iron ABC transporter permease [Arthrobacter zhangbolii]UON93301.1 iron ABC transporter permease [Arthrobacter zhangbolii]
MQHKHRQGQGWAVGLVLLLFLTFASLTMGSRPIPLPDTWAAMARFDPSQNTHLLVRELRLPRTLLAVAVGAALGLAGALMQALTRNPLAEPGILGVNAGAAFAVATGLTMFSATSPQEYMFFGFTGAAATSLVVYLLGRAHDAGTNPVRLVLAGAGLSVMLGAATSILLLSGSEETYSSYANWATGSLQGRGYDVLPWVLGAGAAAAAMALPAARSLDSLSLGADLGRSLGVRVRTTWIIGTAAILLLAGAATAAAGPIGFLGLAAPHTARLIVGPAHRRLLPFSMLLGAVLLLCADVLGRLVAAPDEIGAGVMSALVGAPFFIALARRRKLARL